MSSLAVMGNRRASSQQPRAPSGPILQRFPGPERCRNHNGECRHLAFRSSVGSSNAQFSPTFALALIMHRAADSQSNAAGNSRFKHLTFAELRALTGRAVAWWESSPRRLHWTNQQRDRRRAADDTPRFRWSQAG